MWLWLLYLPVSVMLGSEEVCSSNCLSQKFKLPRFSSFYNGSLVPSDLLRNAGCSFGLWVQVIGTDQLYIDLYLFSKQESKQIIISDIFSLLNSFLKNYFYSVYIRATGIFEISLCGDLALQISLFLCMDSALTQYLADLLDRPTQRRTIPVGISLALEHMHSLYMYNN